MSSVKEDLNAFQKAMWSHSKPLLFAVAVVEELLKENERLRSVMLAALSEIDNNLDAHLTQTGSDNELFRLLDNLCLKSRDTYSNDPERQKREEFIENVRNAVDFSNLEE